MKVWTDTSGNKLTAKEFASRWKSGVQAVTPLQQMKVTLFGYFIVIVGIIWGIIFTAIIHTWWLLVILCGSLFVSGMQTLGALQKYIILNKIEKEVNNAIQETESPEEVSGEGQTDQTGISSVNDARRTEIAD